ncbi:MAG: winged helix-turn-helix domain-containing protein [Algibacter sp.]|uniref:winged helix-turn-helix domain-containing protein n=1 Tax=Algibacter sp. TaxID=1872428 RepID=UPI00329A576B
MNNKLMDSFIASNKVIRHELGSTAADILAELNSKYTFWDNKNQLLNRGGALYFFTSLNDLRSETGYSKNVISKHIKILKEHGLVKSIQQGLNKPNLYSINKNEINCFITKHENSFKDWQRIVREVKLYSLSNINKGVNDISGITNKEIQESSNKCTTNNLYTNNKSTKNFITNRASSVNEFYLSNKLEDIIDNIRSCTEKQKEKGTTSLFEFLCSIVPYFEGFIMSEKDKALLVAIVDSEIEVHKFSSRIISNAININERQKNARFGNLFVGVKEMVTNYNNLF